MTFNFADSTTPSHLASQNYAICIRPEAGYCCVEYQQCSDANSFSLSHVDATKAKQDETCTEDYAQIDGVAHVCAGPGTPLLSRLCGAINILSTKLDATVASVSVYDTVPPFDVQIVTDATTEAITGQVNRGLCFDYKQVPC